jgi:hypothetical protein
LSSILEADVILPVGSRKSLQIGVPLAMAGADALDGTSLYLGSLRFSLLFGADLGTSYAVNDDDGFGEQFTAYLTLGAALSEASGHPGLFVRIPLDGDARSVLDLSIGLSAQF